MEYKTTNAWKLKIDKLKEKREVEKLIKDVLEQEKLQKEEQKRAFAYKIRARIDKSKTAELSKKNEVKRKQFVEDQKRRAEEYRNSIKDMQSRINARMCLFEQEEIAAAKLKAKADFDRILQESGVFV